jgi:hypothetical protein
MATQNEQAPVSIEELLVSSRCACKAAHRKGHHFATGVPAKDFSRASDLSAHVKANVPLNFQGRARKCGGTPRQSLLGASDYRLLCCPRPYYRVQRQ